MKRYLFCLIVLVVSLAASARAEEGELRLDDVVVIAEKRSERQQQVPLSLTVLDRETLTQGGVHGIRDAAAYVPNLFVYGFAPRQTTFPFYRGLGGTGFGEPLVTVYVDDVPQLSFSTHDLALLDIDHLEFIRGPQGTLYGRNTIGGVIQIVTRPPGQEVAADASITAGSYELQRYDLSLQMPLVSDQASLGISGRYTSREGYVENLETGHDVDHTKTKAGRAQLLLTPTDDLDIRLSLFAQQDREGGFVLYDLDRIRDNPHRIRHDFEGYADRDIIAPAASLRLHGDGLELIATSAFQHWETSAATDTDFTQLDMQRRFTEEEEDTFFQELRLQSPTDDALVLAESLELTWVFGGTWFHTEFYHDEINEIRPGNPLSGFVLSPYQRGRYELEDWGLGLFTQGTLTWQDQVDLTAGLRYQYEDKRWDVDLTSPFAPGAYRASFSEDYEQWLPRLGLAYRPTADLTAYTYMAKGYRSGGYNRNTLPGGSRYQYDEETSWTYEAGLKTRLLEQRLLLNLAVFQVHWQDMQLNLPNPAFPGAFLVDNAGEARSTGFELEGRARLTPNLTVKAGLGYARAIFTEYNDPATGCDVSGRRLPNVPDSTWHTGLDYRRPLDDKTSLYTGVELTGFGDLTYDNTNSEGQNDVILLNLRAGVTHGDWTLEAWVRNLTDETYVHTAIPSSTTSGFVGRAGPPRTLGLTLSVRF